MCRGIHVPNGPVEFVPLQNSRSRDMCSSPPQVPGAKFGADFAVAVGAAAASFDGGPVSGPGGASAAADGPRHSAVVPGSNPAGLRAHWFARGRVLVAACCRSSSTSMYAPCLRMRPEHKELRGWRRAPSCEVYVCFNTVRFLGKYGAARVHAADAIACGHIGTATRRAYDVCA